MLGGDVPLTVTAGPEGVVAKLQGADIALLSANNPTMHFSLFVSPEIKKAEDLRGKTSGHQPIRLRLRFFHSLYFQVFGFIGERRYDRADRRQSKPAGGAENERDSGDGFYNAQHRAGAQSRFCLARRRLQAGAEISRQRHRRDRRFSARPPARSSNSSSKVFWKEWPTRKHHKEESLPLIKEFMKLKDQDEAEDTYQVIIRDIQPRKPYPLKEGVETVLRNIESTIPKAKTVKAEELIDDSIMRRMDQSGFIDALYR